LNTNEFINSLAERLHVSRKKATQLLEESTRVFRDMISEEKKLTLRHLGSFQVKKSPSRTAYIPALRKKALVPPRRIIQFHVAEKLMDKLKNTGRP
jgi:nucleoid DNA-binding protein